MSRPKLLLADDSLTIQKVVDLTFADQGMDVVIFSDGDQAVENLDEVRPDVVLADVNMPGINGYQLCELMRSDNANKDIPVLLLVGSFEPFDREEAVRVGASGYLTKPFTSIAELVSTVQGLLANSTAKRVEEHEPETGSQPTERLPDTSDIDSLYQKSLAETVEIPRGGASGLGFPEDDVIDDELMIETSYRESANDHDDEFLSMETTSDFASEVDDTDHETESLVFESLPLEENIQGETEPGSSASAVASQEQESAGPYSASEETFEAEPAGEAYEQDHNQHSNELAEVDEQPVSEPVGPFDAFAGEPLVSSHAASGAETQQFSFDELDLLELPGSAANGSASAPPNLITEVSPEVIDLIVEKVLERLQNKN